MRILFVDDDPENVESLARVLRDAFGSAEGDILVATTVEAAVAALHRPGPDGSPIDIVITDLFIPMGLNPRRVLGPRSRRHAQDIEHLGGLVLLDEIDRVVPAPVVLAHTACTDPVLVSLLGERVHSRVRKPAPFEVLLNAIMGVVREREAEKKWG